jgi:hypothetical protein
MEQQEIDSTAREKLQQANAEGESAVNQPPSNNVNEQFLPDPEVPLPDEEFFDNFDKYVEEMMNKEAGVSSETQVIDSAKTVWTNPSPFLVQSDSWKNLSTSNNPQDYQSIESYLGHEATNISDIEFWKNEVKHQTNILLSDNELLLQNDNEFENNKKGEDIPDHHNIDYLTPPAVLIPLTISNK